MAEAKKLNPQHPKRGGRKAGVPNKDNKLAKEAINEIIQGNAEKVKKMFDLLVDPKDFITLYIKLAEFCLPKMSSVSVSAEGKKSDLKSELEELGFKKP